MRLYPFIQFFVNIHNGVISTILAKSLFNKRIKRITLSTGRKWCCTSKHLVDESAAELLGIFAVVQKSVNIRATVIKYREKEAQIRHFYNPVTNAVFDIVGFSIVTESCFREIDRTDTAENVVVDLIGCIKHFLPIGRFTRNVINSMDQDNIIILTVIIIFNDFVIEFFENSIILKFASAESQKKFLRAAFFFLIKREFHVDQIFADSAG